MMAALRRSISNYRTGQKGSRFVNAGEMAGRDLGRHVDSHPNWPRLRSGRCTRPKMVSRLAPEPPSIRQDGFGTRLIEQTPTVGRVERLMLPASGDATAEQAIRARAAHLTSLGPTRSDASCGLSAKVRRSRS